MTPRRPPLDADHRLVRSAVRRVATTITVAVSVLVLGVLVAAFSIVFTQIPLDQLLNPRRQETVVDIEGLDIVIGGAVLGIVAIVLSGGLALLVTRRAVKPLVDALRRQRQFVADASHELRTPLAILDARIQVLQRALPPDSPHKTVVSELRNDSRSVIAVVSDLLEEIELSTDSSAPPAAVGAAVGDAVSAMRMLATERQVSVVAAKMSESVEVAMPASSLQRSIIALLDNAIKHSSAGSTVTVTPAMDGPHHVRIDVADTGPGIRGVAPTRVFDRFARSADAVDGGGTSRTGFGIGLSLVQDTVARYGGQALVSATSSAGTTMTVRLPINRRNRAARKR